MEPCLVALRTAELIKYACNAFHATKISFANAKIGALAEILRINPEEVLETLCRDGKLNISAAYPEPGFAFGGSCLPKDLRALRYQAAAPRSEAPPCSNRFSRAMTEHLHRAIESAMDLGPARIGVVGLAFKENTDDLRESPVVTLLEHLIGKGRELRVFDPHIQLNRIYGSKSRLHSHRDPAHIGKLLAGNFAELATWAEHLVVTQKPSPDLARMIEASGLPVLDVARGLK